MNRSSTIKTCAIILAAGVGSRMQSKITKQKLDILGHSVLYHSVMAFDVCELIDSIVVVVRESELEFAKAELASSTKVCGIVIGGDTRAESARCGFLAIPGGTDFVAIHDAARPLITPDGISAVVTAAHTTGAASALSPVTDTVKQVDENGFIVSTLDRSILRRAQTPQVFSVEIYRRALAACDDFGSITDDNMLVERIGVAIKGVDVGAENPKITVPEDMAYAEFLLNRRIGGADGD